MKKIVSGLIMCAFVIVSGCKSNGYSHKRNKDSSEISLTTSTEGSTQSTSQSSSSYSSSQTTKTSATSIPPKNYFTVTWLNWNGTILEIDNNVLEGEFPSFNGETPKRDDEGQYSYIFNGWTPSLAAVQSNVTYTAKYITSDRYLDVTWENYDKTLLGSSKVKYGEKPIYEGTTPKRDDTDLVWTFIGWNPVITNIYENTTYTAQFSSSVKYECDNVYHWVAGGSKESHDYVYGAHQTFTCSICGHTAKQAFTCSTKTDSTTSKKYFSDFSGYIEGTKDFIVPKIYGVSETVYDVRELRKYLSEVENLWLPSTLYNVDLSGLTSLKQVNFENTSVTEMPLIYDINSLTQITLPRTLSKYDAEDYAFILSAPSLEAIYVDQNNNNFTSINGVLYSKDCSTLYRIPASMTSCSIDERTTTISTYAGYECRKLASLLIPNGVTTIGKYAFYACESLVEINLPDSITTMGTCVFKDCINLKSVSFPDNNSNFSYLGLLSGCNNVETLLNVKTQIKGYFDTSVMVTQYDESYKQNSTTPETIRTISFIGTRVLPGDVSGTTARTIILSSRTTELYNYAFDHSPNLTVVDFNGAPITKIPSYCFRECSSLTQIAIPDTVTTVYEFAFQNCTKLVSVTIPISVNAVGYDAFDGCGLFSEIRYEGTIQQWGQINKGAAPSAHPTVYCTDGTVTW